MQIWKEEVKPWSQGWLIATGAYPGFCCMKRLEVFLLPLDGMLVHRRPLPRNFARFPQQFAGTHLYTWVERGTVRVKCLAQEHNTMSPARARTRTTRSGVERTNHEATAPPTNLEVLKRSPEKPGGFKNMRQIKTSTIDYLFQSILYLISAFCFTVNCCTVTVSWSHGQTVRVGRSEIA